MDAEEGPLERNLFMKAGCCSDGKPAKKVTMAIALRSAVGLEMGAKGPGHFFPLHPCTPRNPYINSFCWLIANMQLAHGIKVSVPWKMHILGLHVEQ